MADAQMLRPCLFLGRVEVLQPMRDLTRDQRLRMTNVCCAYITGKEVTPHDRVLFGQVERGGMGVTVELSTTHISIFNGSYMVSKLAVKSLSALSAISGTGGQLVVLGHCERKEKRVAVVLEFADEYEADLFIVDYQAMKSGISRNGVPSPPVRKPSDPVPPSPTIIAPPVPRFPPRSVPRPEQTSPSADKNTGSNIYGFKTNVPSESHGAIYGQTKSPPSDNSAPPLPSRDKLEKKGLKIKLSLRKSHTSPDRKLPTSPDQNLPTSPSRKLPTPPDQKLPTSPDRKLPTSPDQKLPPPAPPSQNRFGVPTHPPRPLPDQKLPPPVPPSQNRFGVPTHPPRPRPDQKLPPPVPPSQNRFGVPTDPPRPLPDLPSPDTEQEESQSSDEFSDEYSNEDSDDCYENDQEYYEMLGLSVKDSERLFTNISHVEEETGGSHEEAITYFLTEEYKYLNSIGNLRVAKTLSQKLPHLLHYVDALEKLHHAMYTQLYNYRHSCSAIAQVFLNNQGELQTYKYFLMNAPLINEELTNLPETVFNEHPELKTTLRIAWKRLHFYFMHLESLASIAPESDKPKVQEAAAMLRELNRLADAGILIDAVKDAPFDLHAKGTLLLHSSFNVKMPDLRKQDYRVLLFAEMLVITLPQARNYKYQRSLRLDQLHVVHPKTNPDRTFALEVYEKAGIRPQYCEFRAPNEETRNVWFAEINRLLSEIAALVKSIRYKRFGSTRESVSP